MIPIDISNNKDLLRLAEEVRKSKTLRELKKDDKTLVVLVPADTASEVVDTAVTHQPTGLWSGHKISVSYWMVEQKYDCSFPH